MRLRSLLATGIAAVAVSVLVPMSAQAESTEFIDRSLFDATPERTASHIARSYPQFLADCLAGTLPAVSFPDPKLRMT